jgi:hypothetical protein
MMPSDDLPLHLQCENRDRSHFLQSKLGLLIGGGLLARPSWRSLPGSPTKHGRNLPLEPRAAKHKTAIGAGAQALEQFGAELVLE